MIPISAYLSTSGTSRVPISHPNLWSLGARIWQSLPESRNTSADRFGMTRSAKQAEHTSLMDDRHASDATSGISMRIAGQRRGSRNRPASLKIPQDSKAGGGRSEMLERVPTQDISD